jgi:hypothetical protein
MTVEAKSGQMTAGTLSMEYVRQANTHLDSLRADREEEPPAGSVSVVVSSRTIVDPDAVPIAVPHLHLASPDLVLDVARDAVRTWTQIRGALSGAADEDLRLAVAKAFWEHQVLPTQTLARLTIDPFRGA